MNLQLAEACGNTQNSEKWAILDSNSKSQSTPNKELNKSTQSQEVQNQVHILTNYPELATIITAWPGLSEDTRQAIKALVQTHTEHK